MPFQRVLKRRNPKPTDLVFPKTHHELFNTILGELGLKIDREGQRRTFYSLRHTYICMRLMEGADVYQIAKNCRTSVKMIEEFYASHIKNMVDASVINVRRAKPPKARTRKAKRRGKRPTNPLEVRWLSWLKRVQPLYTAGWYAGVAKLVDARDLSD